MNMTIPIKNGLPWTSLYKLPINLNYDLLKKLQEQYSQQNWGSKFENNRRLPRQTAIYACTRGIGYNPLIDRNTEHLKELSFEVFDEIKKAFPIKITFCWTEYTVLIPQGYIPWHHDRMKMHNLATQIMIPLTENANKVISSFSSWRNDTPNDDGDVSALKYKDTDLYELTMEIGNAYMFNHRVPHSAKNYSNHARGMYVINVIDSKDVNEASGKYGPITEFEKTKLLEPYL